MDPNAMTDPNPVKQDDESKRLAIAKRTSTKNVYRRLMVNEDFKVFYSYLEMCYNSYIESGGEAQIPKDTRDHLLAEAATLHKILKYLERQAN